MDIKHQIILNAFLLCKFQIIILSIVYFPKWPIDVKCQHIKKPNVKYQNLIYPVYAGPTHCMFDYSIINQFCLYRHIVVCLLLCLSHVLCCSITITISNCKGNLIQPWIMALMLPSSYMSLISLDTDNFVLECAAKIYTKQCFLKPMKSVCTNKCILDTLMYWIPINLSGTFCYFLFMNDASFGREEDVMLLVFFSSIMKQNWAETISDIVN